MTPSVYFENSQPRRLLPMPAGPTTETSRASLLAAGRVEQVLEQAQLVVATDERGLQRLGSVATAELGDDTEGVPGRHGRRLALERLLAGLLEGDGVGRCSMRRLADEDRAGSRGRLQATGSVDEVAGDHALVRRPERDRSFSGQDAGAGLDRRPERPDGVDELERGPHGALGVVFVRGRRTPDGHDRVADELLDRAAVPADHVPGEVEVGRQQLARVLGVLAFGQRGEPDEVGEQDRDEAALGDRGPRVDAAR